MSIAELSFQLPKRVLPLGIEATRLFVVPSKIKFKECFNVLKSTNARADLQQVLVCNQVSIPFVLGKCNLKPSSNRSIIVPSITNLRTKWNNKLPICVLNYWQNV